MQRPNAILTIPETPDASAVLVHRYPNGDVMLKQSEDLVYLEASQLIVLADFLFHRTEV